jgi:hypothetical protein
MYTLAASSGREFRVPEATVKRFATIMDLIEDTGLVRADDDAPIPLHNIAEDYFDMVLRFIPIWDAALPETLEEEDDVADGALGDYTFEEIRGILNAANYLNYKELQRACIHRMAVMTRGKTPPELREMLGLEDDFTDAQREEIRKGKAPYVV